MLQGRGGRGWIPKQLGHLHPSHTHTHPPFDSTSRSQTRGWTYVQDMDRVKEVRGVCIDVEDDVVALHLRQLETQTQQEERWGEHTSLTEKTR